MQIIQNKDSQANDSSKTKKCFGAKNLIRPILISWNEEMLKD